MNDGYDNSKTDREMLQSFAMKPDDAPADTELNTELGPDDMALSLDDRSSFSSAVVYHIWVKDLEHETETWACWGHLDNALRAKISEHRTSVIMVQRSQGDPFCEHEDRDEDDTVWDWGDSGHEYDTPDVEPRDRAEEQYLEQLGREE